MDTDMKTDEVQVQHETFTIESSTHRRPCLTKINSSSTVSLTAVDTWEDLPTVLMEAG